MNLIKLNKSIISPNIEIYRGIKYENILKSFISNTSKNLGKEIFNKKKTFIRTLTNLLASWMFTLYSKYDFKEDPFFPEDCNYIDNLRSTLINFSKFDKDIKNVEDKVDTIIFNLKNSYNNNLQE